MALTPVYDLVAERNLLGSILGGGVQTFMEVLDIGLERDDFWTPLHQRVWVACVEILEERPAVDAVLVTQRLLEQGQINGEQVEEIWGLPRCVASYSNGSHYAAIVRRLGTQRRAAKVAKEAVAVLDGEAPRGIEQPTTAAALETYLGSVTTRLMDVVDSKADDHVEDGGAIAAIIWEDIESIHAGEVVEARAGFDSGFKQLDQILGGFCRDDTVLIGGATSMGKTAFTQALVLGFLERGLHVRWQSFEMPKTSMMRRFVSSGAGVPVRRMMPLKKDEVRGDDHVDKLHGRDIEAVASFMGKGLVQRLTIDDRPAPMSTIRLRAKRQKMLGQLDVLVVDHLHISMPEPYTKANRERQLSDAGERLKAIGKELEIPVIGLVQFNKDAERRAANAKSKGEGGNAAAMRPQISDIGFAAALSQIATKILFVHRPEYYDVGWTPQEPRRNAEIIIAKNRDGERAVSAWTHFEPKFARFSCPEGPRRIDINRFHAMGEAADALAHY